MFNEIGKISIVANGKNLLKTNANPQINSIALTKGMRYFAASMPSLKVFIPPINWGCGNRFKK